MKLTTRSQKLFDKLNVSERVMDALEKRLDYRQLNVDEANVYRLASALIKKNNADKKKVSAKRHVFTVKYTKQKNGNKPMRREFHKHFIGKKRRKVKVLEETATVREKKQNLRNQYCISTIIDSRSTVSNYYKHNDLGVIRSEYNEIMTLFFQLLGESLIKTGLPHKLPNNLGILQVMKFKPALCYTSPVLGKREHLTEGVNYEEHVKFSKLYPELYKDVNINELYYVRKDVTLHGYLPFLNWEKEGCPSYVKDFYLKSSKMLRTRNAWVQGPLQYRMYPYMKEHGHEIYEALRQKPLELRAKNPEGYKKRFAFMCSVFRNEPVPLFLQGMSKYTQELWTKQAMTIKKKFKYLVDRDAESAIEYLWSKGLGEADFLIEDEAALAIHNNKIKQRNFYKKRAEERCLYKK